MGNQTAKDLGAVYTPKPVVEFLTTWAIRDPRSTVLDIGAGEGIFLIEAFHRLQELGCEPEQAVHQLHGVELDKEAIENLRWRWLADVGRRFPNVHHADLFDTEFPPVDAIVGNPPYVARSRIREVDRIRERISETSGDLHHLGRLSDLYAYFLVYATNFLKTGGRLAVVLSSSWLDANYGIPLKRFLLDKYDIKAIFGFERRLFDDALVKPVLLLAEKIDVPREEAHEHVSFIRVADHFDPRAAQCVLSREGTRVDGQMVINEIRKERLDPDLPWGIFIKAPRIYAFLVEKPLMTCLSDVAYTRIGLQTLAKGFYIIDREQLVDLDVEDEYWQPMAFSPREFSSPVIDSDSEINHFLFYCDQPKDVLAETNALSYIEWGEQAMVPVRHKRSSVQGYHNKRRLQQARRNPWYNIKSEVERRGRLPILIPRRVYEDYMVIWNRANVVPNEDFIEAKPNRPEDLFPLLGVLNSSLAELLLRMHAQVYGGGVFNINPGQIKRMPTVDVRKLDKSERDRLSSTYSRFVKDSVSAREELDNVVFDLVGLNNTERNELLSSLAALKKMATVSKRRYQ